MPPPWAAAKALVMESPRPVPATPSARRLKKGWKIRARSAGSIPTPVSVKTISTRPADAAQVTVRVPPLGMACRAFWARLRTARRSSLSVARMRNGVARDLGADRHPPLGGLPGQQPEGVIHHLIDLHQFLVVRGRDAEAQQALGDLDAGIHLLIHQAQALLDLGLVRWLRPGGALGRVQGQAH